MTRLTLQDPKLPFLPRNRAAIALVLLLLSGGVARTYADACTRADALEIAEAFRTHRWEAKEKNILHGPDQAGIEVHTPDRKGGRGTPENECWLVETANVGVAYKWGGFDTIASFAAGVRADKAAGDIYTLEKRRRGGAAVSSATVGVDCSGFVSRCWKLRRKYDTATLPSICRPLASSSELRAADIMNQPGGHVLLFVRWIDSGQTSAVFYEAAPFSKVRAKEYRLAELDAAGFRPLRFRDIRDS